MDYASLLSGASGALGFGGGVGTAGGAPSATSGVQSGPITTNTGPVRGGGVSLGPTVNVAFPNARLSASDDINPPIIDAGGMNIGILAASTLGLFLLLFLLRK